MSIFDQCCPDMDLPPATLGQTEQTKHTNNFIFK